MYDGPLIIPPIYKSVFKLRSFSITTLAPENVATPATVNVLSTLVNLKSPEISTLFNDASSFCKTNSLPPDVCCSIYCSNDIPLIK